MADPALEQLTIGAEKGRKTQVTLWVNGQVLTGVTAPAAAFLAWMEKTVGAGVGQPSLQLTPLAPLGDAVPRYLHLDQAAIVAAGQMIPVPHGAVRVALEQVSAFTVGRPGGAR